MSYANGTPNYNLPQTVGSDKRDWADTNQAFLVVDAALKTASDNAVQADGKADNAQTTADSAVTSAASAVTTANAASATAQTAAETAQLAQNAATTAQQTATQAASDAQSAQTTAAAAQQTASNADTVALQAQTNIGTMSNLQTIDKTSLVAAINEVLQTGGAMPELDFANAVNITTTTITTSKAGAIVYAYSASSGELSVSVNNSTVISASTSKQVGNLQFIPSGATISSSSNVTGNHFIKFVPYK